MEGSLKLAREGAGAGVKRISFYKGWQDTATDTMILSDKYTFLTALQRLRFSFSSLIDRLLVRPTLLLFLSFKFLCLLCDG